MKRAKVLNQDELKRQLKIVRLTRFQDRNRLVVLLSFLAGLRACKIAQLKVKDVLSSQTDTSLNSSHSNNLTTDFTFSKVCGID